MLANDQQTLKMYYFQVTDLWKRLCELHTLLLDFTFEEYSLLLSSEIEKLEVKLEEKQKTISQIASLEKLRSETIDQINVILKAENKPGIQHVSELLNLMALVPEEKAGKHLYKFNEYLIDIIEKIQAQNKKNQLFINKAILSLRNIREEALGKFTHSTYNSKGNTVSTSLSRA